MTMFFLKDLPTHGILETYKQRFPEMDLEAVDQALNMLRRASLLLRELESYFIEHDLSQTRFLILILLDREPGRSSLSATELAARLDVSKPVVTRTIACLEAEGLVHTLANPEDKRGKLVAIAPEGRGKLYALLPGYYNILQRHMRTGE